MRNDISKKLAILGLAGSIACDSGEVRDATPEEQATLEEIQTTLDTIAPLAATLWGFSDPAIAKQTPEEVQEFWLAVPDELRWRIKEGKILIRSESEKFVGRANQVTNNIQLVPITQDPMNNGLDIDTVVHELAHLWFDSAHNPSFKAEYLRGSYYALESDMHDIAYRTGNFASLTSELMHGITDPYYFYSYTPRDYPEDERAIERLRTIQSLDEDEFRLVIGKYFDEGTALPDSLHFLDEMRYVTTLGNNIEWTIEQIEREGKVKPSDTATALQIHAREIFDVLKDNIETELALANEAIEKSEPELALPKR